MHIPHTALFLLGWSKTSHSLEAPEEDGGWSSAEELINSSDAEEDGGVGPKKLVTMTSLRVSLSGSLCLVRIHPGLGPLLQPLFII
jgi:hypothetical protein